LSVDLSPRDFILAPRWARRPQRHSSSGGKPFQRYQPTTSQQPKGQEGSALDKEAISVGANEMRLPPAGLLPD